MNSSPIASTWSVNTVATIVAVGIFLVTSFSLFSNPKLWSSRLRWSPTVVKSFSISSPPPSKDTTGHDDTHSSPKECLLNNGLAYGPFRDGEGPGNPLPFPTRYQIDEDLGFISTIAKNIRIYGSSGKYADIPGLAKRHGLGVMLGISLGEDQNANEEEINAAVELAHDQITLADGKKVGLVDSIIVGNETLSNSGNQTSTGSRDARSKVKDLVSRIREVKEKLGRSKIPVSTAQIASDWESNLDLAKEVDFVTAHFYPFWDSPPVPVERGAATVLTDYRKLKGDLRAKYGHDVRVVIGETGWPSGGGPRSEAVPSPENQRKFLEEFMKLACENSIEFYYFEAFDEEWKWAEGGSEEWQRLQGHPKLRSSELPEDRTFSGKWIGSSWGIFQSNGMLKPKLLGVFDQPAQGSRANRDIFDQGPLSAYYDMGVDSWPEHKHDWVAGDGGEMRMAYPNGQQAGAVFVTVGKPTQSPRPWKDFSDFEMLSMELRGESGEERVEIGVKNRSDPDNGNEKRIVERLTKDYRPYRIRLDDLRSGHLRIPEGLKQLNTVVEFVFQGPRAETIYARNIRYEPRH